MKIRFVKMHGLGNDFMVIDGVTQSIALNPAMIQNLSHRHLGIGFDQCLLITSSDQPHIDFNYQIFNADGQEVSQCGNGARCIMRFVIDEGLTQKKQILVATKVGKLALKLNQDQSVTVDMGIPLFEPEAIPLKMKKRADNYTIEVDGAPIIFHALNLGNPHAVIIVNDLHGAPVERVGSVLQKHPCFPQGVNVGFMKILNSNHIKLRVYERGVGETLACGSGACAAVVAGGITHRLEEKVKVSLTHGDLTIRWQGDEETVTMTGPAEKVFTGVVNL